MSAQGVLVERRLFDELLADLVGRLVHHRGLDDRVGEHLLGRLFVARFGEALGLLRRRLEGDVCRSIREIVNLRGRLEGVRDRSVVTVGLWVLFAHVGDPLGHLPSTLKITLEKTKSSPNT